MSHPSHQRCAAIFSGVQRTVEYLRINTANPPGNEDRTMAFLARILAAEEIPFSVENVRRGTAMMLELLEQVVVSR